MMFAEAVRFAFHADPARRRVGVLILAGLASMLVMACSSPPSGPGDPRSLPTGTMLLSTPVGPATTGTYLADIESGRLERLTSRLSPFYLGHQGGYSKARNSAYGVYVGESRHIVEMHLATLAVDTLVTVPERAWTGAFDISPDGRSLAIQTATTLVRLWTVDLESGAWSQVIDQQERTDTIPMWSIKWSPDGRGLFAVTELTSGHSEVVRIDLDSHQIEVITPSSRIAVSPWLAVAPDGSWIAHGSDGSITFRDTDGALMTGLPQLSGMVSRPVFSPDGKFLAFEEYVDQMVRIMMVRLSDGRLWELDVDADFEVWLVDWIPGD